MAKVAAGESLDALRRAIPAHTQLVAVAWLRWRLFFNNFHRQRDKGGVMGLLLLILLRMFVWGVFAFMLLAAAAGCGFVAWKAIASNDPQSLPRLLFGISAVWLFLSFNGLSLAASLSSFDPSSLARFPLRFGRYLLVRILLGVLTPSTIAGCLVLVAVAIGIGVANHGLALPALVVLAVYGLMNVFLTRMLAAWSERWFATRGYREIFGVVTTLVFVGIQFVALSGSSSNSQRATGSWFLRFLNESDPFLRWLPPALPPIPSSSAESPLRHLHNSAPYSPARRCFWQCLRYGYTSSFLAST